MLKDKLAKLLEQAAAEAEQKGVLPPIALPAVTLEHPENSGHGDYASSLALKLARAAKVDPMAIAHNLVAALPPMPEIDKVSIAPPGFINFTLKPQWLTEQVASILAAGEAYGNLDLGTGQKTQLEFVSVNPTGPLHVGHGRGAVLGSTLANVLACAGYSVAREYYVNDAGNQIDTFFRSLYARYQQHFGMPAEVPADGYQGSYMVDLAREIAAEKGKLFLEKPAEQAIPELGELGLSQMLQAIRKDLKRLGVEFDVWFSERSLYQGGQYQKAMSLLRERGYVVEKEGATWFSSTALGESKDNVLVRGNATPTYFASDVAYHYNKFLERQFDQVVNIWGADHQGHVSRMKVVMGALGIDPARLKIIICQMVVLRRGQEMVRFSKRSGDIITLREVIDEVGVDACRFFFLSRSADSQMDFDLELAKKQSEDNPVYYVQYAHARIASILRNAEERGIDFQDGDVAVLTSEPELTLIRKMLLLPEIVETVSTTLEPQHLPYYAQDLATVFHSFYKQCRVITENQSLTQARLKLVLAAKIALAKTLHLMGMTAPEKM